MADITYVATWSGFVYVAFVIDVFSRFIVGWRVSSSLRSAINAVFKTELIYRRGPWKSREAVELAVLEWVDWFNNRRLLEPLGYMPPAEFESAYYDKQQNLAMVVGFN